MKELYNNKNLKYYVDCRLFKFNMLSDDKCMLKSLHSKAIILILFITHNYAHTHTLKTLKHTQEHTLEPI